MINMNSESQRVFISYKSEDANLARQLADGLQAAGVRVWFAEYVALSVTYDSFAAALGKNLEEGVKASTHAVMITNRLWSESSYCQREWKWIQKNMPPDHVVQVAAPVEGGTPVQNNPDIALVVHGPNSLRDTLNVIADQLQLSVQHSRAGHRNWPIQATGLGSQLVETRYGSFCVPEVVKRTPLPKHIGEVGQAHEWHFRARIRNIFTGERDRLYVEINVDPFYSPELLEGLTLRDDREVYRKLRGQAIAWLRKNQVKEYGLHLFRQDGAGHFGLTYCRRSVQDPDWYGWSRFMVYHVLDPVHQRHVAIIVEVRLFTRAPSAEAAFPAFVRTAAPLLDNIRESVRYESDPCLAYLATPEALRGAAKVGFLLAFAPTVTWLVWSLVTGCGMAWGKLLLFLFLSLVGGAMLSPVLKQACMRNYLRCMRATARDG